MSVSIRLKVFVQNQKLYVAHALACVAYSVATLDADCNTGLLALLSNIACIYRDSRFPPIGFASTSEGCFFWCCKDFFCKTAHYPDLLDIITDSSEPLAPIFYIYIATLAIPVNTLVLYFTFPFPKEIDLFVDFVFTICHT